MPLYDYQCMNCGHVIEDIYLKSADVTEYKKLPCPKCNRESACQFKFPSPATEDWGNGNDGRYFEHLSAKGETFHSKKAFKTYLKEHGLREHAAYE